MRALFLSLCLLMPVEALALSCLRPSVARMYAQARDADDAYVVVRGHLEFDASLLPRTDLSDQMREKPLTRIPARLHGRSLSQAGFDLPFDRLVTLEVACFGPWCGSAPVASEIVAFLRKDAAGYALAVDPCGGLVFSTPKAADIATLLSCHKGGACED